MALDGIRPKNLPTTVKNLILSNESLQLLKILHKDLTLKHSLESCYSQTPRSQTLSQAIDGVLCGVRLRKLNYLLLSHYRFYEAQSWFPEPSPSNYAISSVQKDFDHEVEKLLDFWLPGRLNGFGV